MKFPTGSRDYAGSGRQSPVHGRNEQAHVTLVDQKPNEAPRCGAGTNPLNDLTSDPAPVVHADETKGALIGGRQGKSSQTSIILIMAVIESVMRESAQVVLRLGALIRLGP